jgi:hypothetical protein
MFVQLHFIGGKTKFKSSNKFTIQVALSPPTLHMHRASMLRYGPHFIGGERNLSTKEGRLFVWYVLFVGFAYKGKDMCLDSL